MVSHWSLRDNKFSQVSRILLSILSDLNNTVVWMTSISPLIPKSSRAFTNLPIRSGLIQVHQLQLVSLPTFSPFLVLWKILDIYLYFCFLLILFCGLPGRPSLLFGRFSFLLTITRSGRLAGIRISICISKSQRSLCVSSPLKNFRVVHKPLVLMVKFKFLAQITVDDISHPVMSCLTCFLCWFAAFAIRLIVSSLSPHNLHLLVCSVFFIYDYFAPFRVFHNNVSQWFLPGVWVTASLLKSPGLSSLLWPILIRL